MKVGYSGKVLSVDVNEEINDLGGECWINRLLKGFTHAWLEDFNKYL